MQCLLDLKCIKELNWWIQNLPNSWAPIRRLGPTVFLASDASKRGWGACFEGGTRANKHFSLKEQPLSINTKETLAIYYALCCFKDKLANQHICLRSDNSTAIAFSNHKGEMSSELHDKISMDIWNLVTGMNSWLTVVYIPSKENIDSDIASRLLSERGQWTLET